MSQSFSFSRTFNNSRQVSDAKTFSIAIVDYAKVGGISLKELNAIEYEFVKLMKYSLFIRNDTFDKYKIYLNHYQSKK